MWQNYLIIALVILLPVSGALIWRFVFGSLKGYLKILSILISVIDRAEDIGLENLKPTIKGLAENQDLEKRLNKLVKIVTEGDKIEIGNIKNLLGNILK